MNNDVKDFAKPRVCLLNDSFPPIIDGVANAVYNYASVIERLYGGVIVSTPKTPGVKDEHPFPVARYPSVNIKKIAHCRTGVPFGVAAARRITAHEPDIIHSHCPFASGVFARVLRRLTGAPVVMTYHTKFDIDIANIFGSPLARAAAARLITENAEACDEVWAVSRGAGENLKSLGYEGEWRVMENGTDFPLGRASESEMDAVSSEHGLTADAPVFLFVGRMMWYKGVRIILDGLNKAKSRGTRFHMIFVGGGTELDEIKKYAEENGLGGECVFTGPVYDREKLRAYFSRADMFLFPSSYDTNGIVVREAAACSLGSVLIRGSCAAEGVEDGVNGVLIDENADSLAETVAALSGNIERARSIGARAAETIYLSWEDAVKAAYARYGEIIEKHKSSS
ncbi:MAG: glycosyltransferase [Oscillospiraceae bacterium]|jgi:glycosyltransferase involved in cell wall biosynthesis|nr:glycosyltransferase [Oscillospiraceae bacterium]